MNWTEVNFQKKKATRGYRVFFLKFLKQMGAQCELEREKGVWEMERKSEDTGGKAGRLPP